MKAAIYARVSTERQAERGTIGSQVQALRAHRPRPARRPGRRIPRRRVSARLDRPGLDVLRDAAEAGVFEVVWCLSPDRLARSYAYQVLILDELARFGVTVAFTDDPGLDQDDPQAKLLTQVQGVIAEYERAKIGERYRRGKLFRAGAGEVISWKAPYGYRRIPRGPGGPAHLEIFEPEAVIARRIFAERAAGTTIRQNCRQLNADAVPTPTGSRSVWGTSTLGRILGNEAYIGHVYFNRTETVPDRRPGYRSRQVPRPRSEWIAISCPAIITDQTFQAAGKASTDNANEARAAPNPAPGCCAGWSSAGPAGVGTSCHKMRGRNGTWHRYYYCHNHDPLRAGGQDRRCPERNIRADALDEFVFTQIRAALLDPGLLLAGEQAITVNAPVPDDQLLAAELARLDRKLETARGEHNRLIDLYQAGLPDTTGLQPRRRDHRTATRTAGQTRPASPPSAPTSPAGTGYVTALSTSPPAWPPSSTTSTQPSSRNCCSCSSKTSRSPAGISRSGCASHSTTRQTTVIHTTPHHNPARRTPTAPTRPCQPKTVCVPFMFMNGASYRPSKRPGRVIPTRTTSSN